MPPVASVCGGKAQPAPMNSWPTAQPPISTVGQPATTAEPHTAVSPTLAAGCPPMSTVALPGPLIAEIPCSGAPQVCGVPTVAAGWPPIRTEDRPGPLIAPPWPVGSPPGLLLPCAVPFASCGVRTGGRWSGPVVS